VLKITGPSRKDGMLTLKLEGQILAPWLSAVRDACTQHAPRVERLGLDLTDITYTDAAGTQLLRDLLREGVQIAACSSFVAELLRLKNT
jgi:ABC-type transporter Mla MlaB component